MPHLHVLDAPLAAVATIAAAVEIWRWRRGKGSGWWATFYLMGGVLLLVASSRPDL